MGANELGSVSSRGAGVSMRPRFSPPRDTYGSMVTELTVQSAVMIGSLSNVDTKVNENGKKATGLDWQNNNFVPASRFFVHFFTVTARKTQRCLISRFVEDGNTRKRLSFSFPGHRYSLIELTSRKNCQQLSN